MIPAPSFTQGMAVHIIIGSLPVPVCFIADGLPGTLATALHSTEVHGSPGQKRFEVQQIQNVEFFGLLHYRYMYPGRDDSLSSLRKCISLGYKFGT